MKFDPATLQKIRKQFEAKSFANITDAIQSLPVTIYISEI